ncbi:hypothetical protein VP01_4775g2 [Puccinia sorghi]|uniref:Uncharacterized protein n=1 Tax=Puccinia sorghi TaxID=27349 RepID=A0A0L6UPN9_9BASI|nr:hypothetical protein VP01_4775g2 [Puccinia sorghi]
MSNELLKAIFQVALKTAICGQILKKDWSGSTKHFHKHLLRVNRVFDLKLTKKVDLSQYNIKTGPATQ